MTVNTIRARIAADHEDMAGVTSVSVFGHKLGPDYAEIDVSDEVLAKLKGNPTVEVLVRKPGPATKVEPVSPPVPPAPAAQP